MYTVQTDGLQVEKERKIIERNVADYEDEIRECKRFLHKQSERNEKTSSSKAALEM